MPLAGCLGALLLVVLCAQPGTGQYWCNGRSAITMPASGCSGVSVCSPLIAAVTQTRNWWNGTNNTVGNSLGVAGANFFNTFAYSPLISITNTDGTNGAYSTACKKIAAIVGALNLWANKTQANFTYGNATFAASARDQMWATMIPAWGHTIGDYIACGASCTNYTTTTSTTTTMSPTTTTTTIRSSTAGPSTVRSSTVGPSVNVGSTAKSQSTGGTNAPSTVRSSTVGTSANVGSTTPGGTSAGPNAMPSPSSAAPSSAVPSSAMPASAGPSSTMPASVAPSSAAPSSTVPASAAPSSTVPASAAPSSAVPSSTVPASAAPSSVAPSSTVPASAAPSSAAPSSTVPASAAPSSDAPASAAPSSAGPSSTVPASVAPSSAAPSSTVPASAAPSSTVPASAAPSSDAPSSAAPSSTVPASVAPSSAGPSSANPSTAGPASTTSSTSACGQSSPVVTTPTFSVMGITLAINMSAVPAPTNITTAEIFYGVPFAQPPIGELRFEKPCPVEPYSATLNCTTVTNIPYCHNHVDFSGFPSSEDCLKLVIYRPACTTDADRLPVLVWIHGGAYVSGGAFPYAPPYSYGFPNFYVSQGIIVVQVQYRLSLYGFGTDGTTDFPGNYGLFDQQLALQWISENIDAFGGDCERVTLLGESAGGSSVAYQSIQPNSTCFFRQAIQMSGSFNSPWAAPSTMSVTSTAAIAAMLNCSSGSLKACLQAVDIATLEATISRYPKLQLNFDFISFGPTFDNDFINDDFLSMMEQADEKPTLIGFNSDESLFLDAFLALGVPGFTMPPANNFTAANLATLIDGLIVPSDPNNTAALEQIDCIREELIDFYTCGNATAPYFYYQQYTRLLSDIEFIIPALWEARAKSQLGWPVALFHNTYLSPNLAPQLPYPAVPHSSDLPYYLDMFYLYAWTLTPDDLAVRNYWVNFYVDFIKNGMNATPMEPLCYPSNDWCCSQGSDFYTALNIQLAPFVEDCTTADSVPGRLDFWDELSQKYDLTLVKSLPNTMGECVQWD